MRRRRFGSLGTEVPVIGIGTWNMELDPREEAIGAIRRALDRGMVHVDTAELYGRGAVESLVGEAIRGRREEVFLVSKVMPSNASRQGTLRAAEASLKRLGTDHLDVYLLHWPGDHPLEDTIAAFEQLVKEGKIRAWGVSNFDVDELEAAERIAGPDRIACNQVLYHLEERYIEHQLIPWCRDRGVAVVGYSPFGTGNFPETGSPGRAALEAIAAARGVTAHAVALAFLTRDPITFAIPKSARAERVEQNGAAGALVLEPDELATLERTFPLGRRGRGLPTA